MPLASPILQPVQDGLVFHLSLCGPSDQPDTPTDRAAAGGAEPLPGEASPATPRTAATPLRLLILEDQQDDAELMLIELRRAGFEPLWERVETEQEYLARLSPELQLILADYRLPRFDAQRALQRLQARGLDIPFIVVTGAIDEETAVECLEQGAADYVLKDRSLRLGQAVRRALAARELRDRERQAGDALREIEQRLAAERRRADETTGRLIYEQAVRAQLEAAHRALLEKYQARSEFLATVSHELRTPLSSIIGFAELLLTDAAADPAAAQPRRFLGNIYDSGQHLLSLINDMLDLAKLEAGRMELHPSQLEVRAVLHAAVETIRPLAANKGLTPVTGVEPDVGTIYADERRLKQVLYNLLSNAVKFTPEGGRVELTAHLVSQAVEIVVADSGIGIAPEDQERIFEPFRQLPSPRVWRHQGTGLGLALTRRLVEFQGGRIWVESAPGEGSQFAFTVPLRTAPPPGD
jgi:signal transduction histidine kinase